jgi:hypothetical protein
MGFALPYKLPFIMGYAAPNCAWKNLREVAAGSTRITCGRAQPILTTAGQSRNARSSSIKEDRTMSDSIPFACDMTAIAPSKRDEHIKTIHELFAAVEEVRELSDGFSFRLPVVMFRRIADFVELERLCCPFLAFLIEIKPDEKAVWLSLKGREGVKTFILAEIGDDLGSSLVQIDPPA